MNLDITFCQGARCQRTETCARFIERARKIVEANPHLKCVPISVAQFSDHEGNCEHYWHDEMPKQIEGDINEDDLGVNLTDIGQH